MGDVAEWHIELLLELDALDRSQYGREIVERVHEGLWRDACRATVDGDYVAVAETLARIGDEPLQAEMRLLAARTLAAEGRLVEAEEQLERARAFWRSVGATAYLREAEGVISAAS